MPQLAELTLNDATQWIYKLALSILLQYCSIISFSHKLNVQTLSWAPGVTAHTTHTQAIQENSILDIFTHIHKYEKPPGKAPQLSLSGALSPSKLHFTPHFLPLSARTYIYKKGNKALKANRVNR